MQQWPQERYVWYVFESTPLISAWISARISVCSYWNNAIDKCGNCRWGQFWHVQPWITISNRKHLYTTSLKPVMGLLEFLGLYFFVGECGVPRATSPIMRLHIMLWWSTNVKVTLPKPTNNLKLTQPWCLFWPKKSSFKHCHVSCAHLLGPFEYNVEVTFWH